MSVSDRLRLIGGCGHPHVMNVWKSINSGDKHLASAFLNGSLNTWLCPQCGVQNVYEHQLLYHDVDRKIMIYVYDPSVAANPLLELDPKLRKMNAALGVSEVCADDFDSARGAIPALCEQHYIDTVISERPDLGGSAIYAAVFDLAFRYRKAERELERAIAELANTSAMGQDEISPFQFAFGEYSLDSRIISLNGLTEAAPMEYRILGTHFVGEKIFHAPSIEFMSWRWEMMLATVHGQIYKLNPCLRSTDVAFATTVFLGVAQYYTQQFGSPSRVPNGYLWNIPSRGNLILTPGFGT